MCIKSAHCTLSKGHDGRCVEPLDPYTSYQEDLDHTRELAIELLTHGIDPDWSLS